MKNYIKIEINHTSIMIKKSAYKNKNLLCKDIFYQIYTTIKLYTIFL